MKVRLPIFLTVALFLTAAFTPFALRAQSTPEKQTQKDLQSQQNDQDQGRVQDAQGPQNDQDSEDDGTPPRVARLASLEGDVSFQRAGDTDWVEAVRNLPLLPGDQIYTDSNSQAEIQLDRDSFIWMSPGTALAIADFSDNSAQFEVTSGSVIIRVARLASAFNRFEVDSPTAAVVVTSDGTYRLRVDQSGQSELAVKQGAADVTTEQGDLSVREGHQLTVGPQGSDRLEVAELDPNEIWDVFGGNETVTGLASSSAFGEPTGSSQQSSTYDSQIGSTPDYVGTYEDTYNGLYGLDDLSSYGTWTNVPNYGNCWVPSVGSGWAPYRFGEWVWVPAVGWTWLSSEPWGWAPYHYGRWSFFPGLGWAWIPGFGPSYYNYGYSYYQWYPAQVYFFNWNTPQGGYVGWFPLPPGPHPRHWRHRPRPGSDRGRFASGRSPIPTIGVAAARNGGVSVLPVGGLGGVGRPQPAGSVVNSLILNSGQPHRAGATLSDGLPEVAPGRGSMAPLRTGIGGVISAKRPPQRVIQIPVLTRHLPPTQVAGGDVSTTHRQHKLVTPNTIARPRFVPGMVEPDHGVVSTNPETSNPHRDGADKVERGFAGGASHGAAPGNVTPGRQWTGSDGAGKPGKVQGNEPSSGSGTNSGNRRWSGSGPGTVREIPPPRTRQTPSEPARQNPTERTWQSPPERHHESPPARSYKPEAPPARTYVPEPRPSAPSQPQRSSPPSGGGGHSSSGGGGHSGGGHSGGGRVKH